MKEAKADKEEYTRMRDRFGDEYKQNRLKRMIFLNVLVAGVSVIAVLLARFYLPLETQINVIFVVQMFAGSSNLVIWVVTVWGYGLMTDLGEYFRHNISVLDGVLGDVIELKKELESDDFEQMKQFVHKVDWEEALGKYERYMSEDEETEEYLKELDKL